MSTTLSTSISRIHLSSDQVSDYSIIAAIDFGTSSSGYAFGFLDKESGEVQLSGIQLNKCQLSYASSSTDKEPTTVLLKPDKTFDSFGYKAEDKYATLCDTEKQEGWWFFQKFKMMLYKDKISRESMLDDAEGKPMQAKYVFSVAIGHIKDRVLEDVRNQHPEMKDDDILFVLTVPAIWSDAAKQFMRKAATDPIVGIKDSHLKLVLEPEAASVFCQQRNSRIVRECDGNRLDSLEVGHKYILLDLGGGTVDITTHEVIENGQLLEIDYVRGDSLGGQTFNDNFIEFLCDLFGLETFRKWKLNEFGEYLQLQRAIEGMKWEIEETQTSDRDIYFEIPYSLVKHVQHETGITVENHISHSKFAREVKLEKQVKFQLKRNILRSFFDKILTGVTHHMRNICATTSGIESVFMVGGLAKSSYVLKNIEVKFPQFRFIVPEDQGVAVLKGAVMLGNKPTTIAGRIARYSYGIGVVETFVEGKHDEKYKCTRDGKVLCKNLFTKLIEKGQVLKYGDTFTTITKVDAKMSATKQIVFTIPLYKSSSENPFYCTELGCTDLGGIKMIPPAGGWPDYTKIDVKINVGEAEFRFYVEESLGRTYETAVDFLSQT